MGNRITEVASKQKILKRGDYYFKRLEIAVNALHEHVWQYEQPREQTERKLPAGISTRQVLKHLVSEIYHIVREIDDKGYEMP